MFCAPDLETHLVNFGDQKPYPEPYLLLLFDYLSINTKKKVKSTKREQNLIQFRQIPNVTKDKATKISNLPNIMVRIRTIFEEIDNSIIE